MWPFGGDSHVLSEIGLAAANHAKTLQALQEGNVNRQDIEQHARQHHLLAIRQRQDAARWVGQVLAGILQAFSRWARWNGSEPELFCALRTTQQQFYAIRHMPPPTD